MFIVSIYFSLLLNASSAGTYEYYNSGRDTIVTIKDTVVKSDRVDAIIPDTLRKMRNVAFNAGEFLKFDVKYGFITAGEAVMKVSDSVHENQRKCLNIEFQVDSKPFFDVFYKVRDRYSTLVDAMGMFPWRFEQHIREGGYKRDFIADFDQIHHVATTSEGSHPIPPYVHDIMSAFYFARLIDFSDYQ